MCGECEKCGEHALECVCLNDEEEEWMNASLGKIKDKIDEKIRADKMEWIKCSDRLPEFDQPVLCFDPNHDEAKIYVCKLEKQNLYEIDKCKLGHPQQWLEASGESYFTWEPTHWMPLPKAPEN